jgi:predicted nucleotidyltransferase
VIEKPRGPAMELDRLLRLLAEGGTEFILVGGLAAIAHGAARATYDVDVVYARDAKNLRRIVAALEPFAPYPRGAPPGLPFRWDAETLRRGLNFTLSTSLGPLDLLGEIAGGGTYDRLLPETIEAPIAGARIRVVALEALIRLKHAAGRPKDYEAIAELQALLEEKERRDGGSS